jgi:fructose-1,6-bisphosphatase I
MSDSPAAPDFEAPPTDLITLTRHILAQQQKLGAQASGDLTMLLVGIQVRAPAN